MIFFLFFVILSLNASHAKHNTKRRNFSFHSPFRNALLTEIFHSIAFFTRERWHIGTMETFNEIGHIENERKIRVNIWTINLEETIPRFEQKATIYFQVHIYISARNRESNFRISPRFNNFSLRPIKPFNRAANWLPGRRCARSDRDSSVIDRIDPRPLSSLRPRSSKDYDRYTDTGSHTRAHGTRSGSVSRYPRGERVRISGVMLDISRMALVKGWPCRYRSMWKVGSLDNPGTKVTSAIYASIGSNVSFNWC